MRAAAVSFAILLGIAAVSAQGTVGTDPIQGARDRITIELGQEQPADGIVWLTVRTGPLPLGTVLILATRDGSWSETLTPFGVRTGASELVFQVGIPAASVTGTTVVLTARISVPGEPGPRPPTSDELREISLVGACRS